MTDLKPCPFCGGGPCIITGPGYYSIFCDLCEFHPKSGPYAEKENAIQAWNTRPAPDHEDVIEGSWGKAGGRLKSDVDALAREYARRGYLSDSSAVKREIQERYELLKQFAVELMGE